MVGIVLVSHSRPLAEATRTLVQSMTGATLPLAIAAGTGDDRAELGTDAVEISQAIQSVMNDDGVLVLMDMGSALLSAEMAVELLDETLRPRVRFCAAPFIEGAVAAGVTAHLGSPLDQVAHEAEQALRQKQEHLAQQAPGAPAEPVPVAAESPASSIAAPSTAAESIVVTIRNEHGLHARPAARFIQESGRFNADVRVENTTTGKGPVSARSLSELAMLEVSQGHELRIGATGPEAPDALTALRALVESGLGDTVTPATPAPEPQVAPAHAGPARTASPTGAQPVSEGIAIGPVVVVRDFRPVVPKHSATDPEAEQSKLRTALAAARSGLLEHQEQLQRSAGAETADIFAAQALLLDDPVLLQRANELIAREHANAAAAWHTSFLELMERYQNLTDEYLRQRAADIGDVGNRVLAELGVTSESRLPLDHTGILIVEDLTATQVSQLAHSKVSGVICLDGGTTSHSSILLRALGLPSVAQARQVLAGRLRDQGGGGRVAFDGGTGEVWIDPDDRELADITRRREQWQSERARQLASARDPAVTTDGHHVELLANVGQLADAEAAIRSGAEGIGLLRTEFLFLDRTSPPSEDEQVAELQPIAELMGDRPMVVRTLDVGGDKDLPYLGLPREANPFLGVRALRVCLRRPELFQEQLRALLRVGAGHDLRIMFPMVSEPSELDEARRHLDAAHASLAQRDVPHAWPVRTGIMIEVPSAALLADELAQRCDFFSIGTNDLTQYTLAADRGNAELSEFQDPLHPAVLRLIRQVVDAAHRHGRRVAVCGEAAGDVAAARIFIGLGVDELSVTPAAVPKIKEAIRLSNLGELQRQASEAIQESTTRAVRELTGQALPTPAAPPA